MVSPDTQIHTVAELAEAVVTANSTETQRAHRAKYGGWCQDATCKDMDPQAAFGLLGGIALVLVGTFMALVVKSNVFHIITALGTLLLLITHTLNRRQQRRHHLPVALRSITVAQVTDLWRKTASELSSFLLNEKTGLPQLAPALAEIEQQMTRAEQYRRSRVVGMRRNLTQIMQNLSDLCTRMEQDWVSNVGANNRNVMSLEQASLTLQKDLIAITNSCRRLRAELTAVEVPHGNDLLLDPHNLNHLDGWLVHMKAMCERLPMSVSDAALWSQHHNSTCN